MKPGNTPLYVNRHNNHPPQILRNILDAINRRLSNIASDKQSFESVASPYQEAFRMSGFNYVLNYTPNHQSLNVIEAETSYGLNFPTTPMLPPMLVTNFCRLSMNASHATILCIKYLIVKLSYNCMPNVQNIITAHNNKILSKQPKSTANPDKKCNCRQKDSCPLHGKCLTESVVYLYSDERVQPAERNLR